MQIMFVLIQECRERCTPAMDNCLLKINDFVVKKFVCEYYTKKVKFS